MEKTQILVAGIEGFDSTKLRHTETHEKNPLPDKDGKFKVSCYTIVWLPLWKEKSQYFFVKFVFALHVFFEVDFSFYYLH